MHILLVMAKLGLFGNLVLLKLGPFCWIQYAKFPQWIIGGVKHCFFLIIVSCVRWSVFGETFFCSLLYYLGTFANFPGVG